jgi:chromosome partitioning protein
MSKVIAIANQKGGVGKSTTAINLSASLAAAELRVLLADLDPQGNTTSGLGIEKDQLEFSVYDVLTADLPVQEAICPTELETLDALPANRELTGATIELIDFPDREFRLRQALHSIRDQYDFLLIDCFPTCSLHWRGFDRV